MTKTKTKTKKPSAQTTQQSVCECISANPGLTTGEIALVLGRVQSTVQFAICRLKDQGMVRSVSQHRAVQKHYVTSVRGEEIFGVNQLVNLFDRCVMSVRNSEGLAHEHR
ncbi:hypothetical protein [Dickeya fangzhongdai]|uniref:hypothetical protein n=1 Tax=Dickeya fangzhongdai TaxID=1778540 RepID=UPI002B25FC2F|nr:hypothetical protein [Dickeya fangzhongdai]WOX99946.1 hypothetical protein OGM22_20475 [Dickeya fangzhongdai]WOY04905.1 hypothetical protein OGM21_01950 [Dickeya fangzhongdai]